MNKNLEVLRAIAIIIVVLGHSIILYDPSWTLYEPEKESLFMRELKGYINIIQMPLFFSLSGYLFFYSAEKYSFKEFLLKKFYRIIVPYFAIIAVR